MTTEITPESLRQTAAAMEATKAGAPIQYRRLDSSTGTWWDVSNPEWSLLLCEYRPKPEPVSRPWDFNSRPREVTWVYCKGHLTDSMIVAWGDDTVVIATKHGLAKQSYDELFRDWLLRDGSPCGITE